MQRKKNYVIYCLTSPSGRKYIGQTSKFGTRMRTYLRHDCKCQPKLYRSFSKYGAKNHKVEILFDGKITKDEINKLEQHYISLFNSFKSGLNSTSGGEYAKQEKISKKGNVIRLRQKTLGRYQEQKKKRISKNASKYNNMKNPVIRERCIRATIAALKETENGYFGTRRKGKDHQNAKPILKYDLQGNFIAEYSCAAEAGRLNNIYQQSVSKVANGKRLQCRGFVYRWK